MLSVFLFAPAQPALAADAVVGTGTPESCTETAFDSALIFVMGSGSGTITFNCGGAATIVFTSQKIISNAGVTILGGGLITLSGGYTTRLFFVSNTGMLTIHSMTLKNGIDGSAQGGGAIHNERAVWLVDSTIHYSGTPDNITNSGEGGAIWNSGNLSITGSRIRWNGAYHGGGIYNSGNAWLTDTTLSGNKAFAGGGIFSFTGVVSLLNVP